MSKPSEALVVEKVEHVLVYEINDELCERTVVVEFDGGCELVIVLQSENSGCLVVWFE